MLPRDILPSHYKTNFLSYLSARHALYLPRTCTYSSICIHGAHNIATIMQIDNKIYVVINKKYESAHSEL